MVLPKIVASCRRELKKRKLSLPVEQIQRLALEQTPPLDLALALSGNSIRLIAEIKKASPSRGIIRSDFNPVQIAQTYADNGASAISILTEPEYFQGSLDYLKTIRAGLGSQMLPLLRKDFIIDPYQVYESRAYGADSLLLIAAILMPKELKRLLHLSEQLGMKCLVEVHNEEELEIALESDATIIGINNRDLNTFTVDLATTEGLRPLIPKDKIVVSESGIKDRSDIEKLKSWQVDAVLIGEALMSASNIAAKMKELL